MKLSHLLGLNARTQTYSYPYNKSYGRKVATSKLLTKLRLKKGGVPIPKIYAKFATPKKVTNFNWEALPDAFALKPSKGLGGQGIIVVKKRAKSPVGAKEKAKDAWITTQRKRVTIDDLKLHAFDILEGAYSLGNVPDKAFIEEYVGRHKTLRKFAYRGTPDIRVIVFNKVPIMAMLRLPTRESGGRANLHQGAIAVGVDLATGITMRAWHNGGYIKYKPDTKRKLHGVRIPMWTKILETAVIAGEAAGLGYYGADVVLHPEKGPMILELNYQPGLSIQLANGAGLKKRLERVEELQVKDPDHGVHIAQTIFGERFADRVRAKEGIRILKPVERVKVYPPGKKAVYAQARVDTGALRTSIDKRLAESLGLLSEENVLWRRRFAYRSAGGKQSRPVIALTISIKGRKVKTSASVANRSSMSTPILLGRNDIAGFLVDPVESE